jgi:lipoprotein-releasing system permease protein
VIGVSPFIGGQAILRLPSRAFGVLVRGLDPARDRNVSRLSEYVVVGQLPSQEDQVAIGTELAASVHAWPGDKIRLISPADGMSHELTVSGVFRSGMYEFDAAMVAVSLARAQQLFALPGIVSGIGLKLDNLDHAPAVKAAAQKTLGPEYSVRLWMELNPALFEALKLEKLGTFILLTLIVLVASANIISTLVMMVTEKIRDIGILKSIGATNRSIWALFTWEGLLIGVLGTAIGASLAWAIVWSLDTYKFIHLPGNVYYLDYLPVRVEPGDWIRTVTAALVISLLSTIYPARQASRLSPVDALRYE